MNPNEKGQKAAWTAEEEERLLSIVDGLGGPGKWTEVANTLRSGRTDAQVGFSFLFELPSLLTVS